MPKTIIKDDSALVTLASASVDQVQKAIRESVRTSAAPGAPPLDAVAQALIKSGRATRKLEQAPAQHPAPGSPNHYVQRVLQTLDTIPALYDVDWHRLEQWLTILITHVV